MKISTWFFPLLLALANTPGTALAQSQSSELLPPEEAFRLSTSIDGDTLLLRYDIAEGYYLYGDRFAVESASPVVRPERLRVPPGEIRDDPWTGRAEIHRQRVELSLPLDTAMPRPANLALAVRSQGCADLGVCFPPYTHQVDMPLPVAFETSGDASPAAALGDVSDLDILLGGNDAGGAAGAQFLPPEQAYRPRARIVDGELEIGFDIAEGYYLYRDKLGVSTRAPPPARVGPLALPEGTRKQDEYYGDVRVFYVDMAARAPLEGVSPGDRLSVEVAYQGCADAGLCYPPMSRVLDVLVPAAAGAARAATLTAEQVRESIAAAAGVASSSPPAAEQDRIAASIAEGSAWLLVATFFGFGLLLAFTPCVFPMVPILSSLIVGHGKRMTAAHGFTLSAVFVLGMALTYTVAGVLAGLFGAGANLQAAFQNPWVLGAFSALFVLLALSMFGFYDLQIPPSWQTRLARLAGRQRGGTYLGAGIMGVLSALIVGPCVAAPLAGALIYIGRTGDAVLGGTALFALALGMGAPLLVIGASAGRLLPAAGAWMVAVRKVFGVLLLAVAVYLMERVMPAWVTLLAWAVLLIVTAIYMGALDSLTPESGGWRRLWKGSGLVMLVYGVLLMVGAAAGGSDPLQPLRGVAFTGGAARSSPGLQFERVKGLDAVQAAIRRASAEGRHSMLDFYADWCVSCKELERTTFADAGVQARLGDTLLLQVDVTANDADDRALLEHFGLYGPPAMLFFGPDGRERTAYRLVGYVGPKPFLEHVTAAQAPARAAVGERASGVRRVSLR